MTWLPTAIVATATASFVLTLAYWYVYIVEKKRYLGIWAFAWGAAVLRYTTMLGMLYASQKTLFLVTSQFMSLINGMLLFWGVYEYLGARMPWGWIAGAGADVLWIAAAVGIGMEFSYVSLPTFFFMAAVYVWMGIIFMRGGTERLHTRVFVGWTMILWGLHKADYPFLRPVEWLAPWGYLMASVFSIMVAVGIILVYYEENKRLLIKSESRFRHLIDAAGDAIFVHDISDSSIANVNEYACRSLGYTRQELLTLRPSNIEVGFAPEEVKRITESLAEGHPVTVEGRHRRKDGSTFPVEVRLAVLEEGAEHLVLAIARDITERKRAEEALQWTQFSVDNAADAIFWMEKSGRIFYVNKAACRSLDYTRDELLALSVPDVDSLFDAEQWPLHWEELKRHGSMTFESIHRRKDGSEFPVEIIANYMDFGGKAYNCAFVRDITARRRMEESIRSSLQEKDVLLKEIHHRVKNNLQIISALFNMQARHVTDPEAKSQLQESRNRIRAMAMVHERLYQSGDFSKIGLKGYLDSLMEHLFRSFAMKLQAVSYTVSAEDVHLNTDTLITLGLMVTELVSNALKYAFPNGRTGTVALAFEVASGKMGTLRVQDDGVGLPGGIDLSNTETLGFQLVDALARQLEATITVERPEAGGTVIAVEGIQLKE